MFGFGAKKNVHVDRLLQGPSDESREALAALRGSEREDALAALKSAFSKVRDNDARSRLIRAHGEMRDAESVSFFVRLLEDDSEDVGDEAAEALTRLGAEAVPALMKKMKGESDAGVMAIGILARMGGPAAGPLIDALSSRNAYIRLRACEALGEMGDPARHAVSALQTCRDDKDPLVAREAVRALRRLWVAVN